MSADREPRFAAYFTALIALVLQVLPLPEFLSVVRPAFLVIVVLYWSVAAPRAGGIGLGWLSGVALDAFRGAVLGQHALAIALVAYLAIRFHLQLRNKPLFQQALYAFAALFLFELVVWSIDGWSGHAVANGWRWVHPFTGALLWPVVSLFLERAHSPR